ncbi:hypothetical protein BGZ91_001936, partial [Linnemannia elongata]
LTSVSLLQSNPVPLPKPISRPAYPRFLLPSTVTLADQVPHFYLPRLLPFFLLQQKSPQFLALHKLDLLHDHTESITPSAKNTSAEVQGINNPLDDIDHPFDQPLHQRHPNDRQLQWRLSESWHGHCGNSRLACAAGCDAAASFNGRCVRSVGIAQPLTNGSGANGKPRPIPSLPKGAFKVVGNTGVAAQHIALVTPTKMLIIDKAEANPVKLPSGLSAYNAEYDLVTNNIRLLDVSTNTFCSGGGFLPNGTMISAGGAEARKSRAFLTDGGFQSLRMWNPCDDGTCEWIENPTDPAWTMTGNRWYVSITTLPSGELFVLGGSNESLAINSLATNNPTWEIYPKPANIKAADYKPNFMQFMVDSLPNNLYPNVYSLPDGNIFIFANQKSMIFNVAKNEVIKRMPDLPGGPRSYPLTGSHILLPLDPAKNYAHEILRFTEWEPSNIPRMYHSVAMLLPDGSVFVAGSNENSEVRLKDVPFPTEYRVENFTPPYLSTDLARPEIVSKVPEKVTYAQKVLVTVDVKDTSKYEPEVVFMLGHRGFVTHSTHMSQRMTKLVAKATHTEGTKITYEVVMPPNANIMPPGPHYMHMLNNGVPSVAVHFLLN